ncbi:hypothetical protein APR12_005529 [Nocardia amikacinitolerans]|nr:hypothetical protein [Nocardia amikacinitolerans]
MAVAPVAFAGSAIVQPAPPGCDHGPGGPESVSSSAASLIENPVRDGLGPRARGPGSP